MPRTTLSSREDARRDLKRYIKMAFSGKGKNLTESDKVLGISYRVLHYRLNDPKEFTVGELLAMAKKLSLPEDELLKKIRKAM